MRLHGAGQASPTVLRDLVMSMIEKVTVGIVHVLRWLIFQGFIWNTPAGER